LDPASFSGGCTSVRLTIVQYQNTSKKSSRLIVCPYCDSHEVLPSHLMSLIAKALTFFIAHTAAEIAGSGSGK
jgi:hypothetical protein